MNASKFSPRMRKKPKNTVKQKIHQIRVSGGTIDDKIVQIHTLLSDDSIVWHEKSFISLMILVEEISKKRFSVDDKISFQMLCEKINTNSVFQKFQREKLAKVISDISGRTHSIISSTAHIEGTPIRKK